MKILAAQINEDWQGEYLSDRLSGHEVIATERQDLVELGRENSDVEVLSIFVGVSVDAEVMDAFSGLKFITTRSTGFDHVDLDAAKKRGIKVTNVPFYGENTVAEHTLALILALARKLRESLERIEDAKFDYQGLRGWDLKGKQIGIIGGGHIGMHVARMARGFAMNVVVYDLKPNQGLAAKIGFEYQELDDLLVGSDVITLHLPFNEHTKHILGPEQFEKMKGGVYIVNTARGGLIDTDALVAALRSGKVAGAGLDVLEEEDFLKEEIELIGKPEYKDKLQTIVENHLLMEMENVIVTPHNAFNSQEAVTRILQTTVENIQAFAADQEQNLVG